MTLRLRLVTTIVAVVAVGLVAVDLIALSSLHSFLYGRVDSQLDTAAHQVAALALRSQETGVPVSTTRVRERVSPDVYVVLLDEDGMPVVSVPSGTRLQADPAPHLPVPLPVRPLSAGVDVDGPSQAYRPASSAVTVGSTYRSGRDHRSTAGPQYRLLAVSIPGYTLVVATRLDTVTATLDSLQAVLVVLSLGLLVLLMVVIAVIVRRGLRPLDDMTREADAIAAGDLTRRVHPSDGTTEISRLGRALNGMLAQIETAFAQRAGSEERLRSFLADASHELRTPLTSIQGYAELLRKDALPDGEARARALERIGQEATRMGVLVGDLAVLAREDGGPSDRTRAGRPRRPGDRRRRRHPDARSDAPARTRRTGAGARAGGPGPTGAAGAQPDGQRPRATPRRARPVEVRVAAEGTRAVLDVRDHGPGLEPDQAARVFDRFYRGGTQRPERWLGARALHRGQSGPHLRRHGLGGDGTGRGARRSPSSSRCTWSAVPIPSHRCFGRDAGRGAGPGRRVRCPDGGPSRRRAGPPVTAPVLATIDRGRGPTVLLLHGQPGTGASWDPVTDLLAGSFRVLAPDRAGYGATAGEAHGLAANADDGRPPARCPRGGAGDRGGPQLVRGAAVLLAVARPDLVRGLVLVGAACTPDSLDVTDRLLALPVVGDVLTVVGLLALGRGAPEGAPARTAGCRTATATRFRSALPDQGVLGGDRGALGRHRRTFVAEQRALLDEMPVVGAALDRVPVPTAVVAGEWDLVVRPASGRTLARPSRAPNWWSWTGAGHFVAHGPRRRSWPPWSPGRRPSAGSGGVESGARGEGVEDRLELQPRLDQLGAGVGPGHDADTRRHPHVGAVDRDGPDPHHPAAVAGTVHPAHRPGVGAPGPVLEPRDQIGGLRPGHAAHRRCRVEPGHQVQGRRRGPSGPVRSVPSTAVPRWVMVWRWTSSGCSGTCELGRAAGPAAVADGVDHQTGAPRRPWPTPGVRSAARLRASWIRSVVPASGRLRTRVPVRSTSSSGLAPTNWPSGVGKAEHGAAGLEVGPAPAAGRTTSRSVSRCTSTGRASTTLTTSPRWMAADGGGHRAFERRVVGARATTTGADGGGRIGMGAGPVRRARPAARRP